MKKIWNTVTGVLVGVIVLIAVALVGVRFVGLQNYTVLSGSMEPQYPTGSLIYVGRTDTQSLEAGDVITFRLSGGTVATHRIVEVVEESGVISYRTKGDANDMVDSNLVVPEDVIGKVVFGLPFLGYLAAYLQTQSGRYAAIAIGALVLLMVFLPDLIFGSDKKEEGK